MALELKSEFTISRDGTRITVTDKTGVYDVTDNPGGWGAPNPELNESCLVCLVIRKASGGDQLMQATSPSVDYVYDAGAANSDEKSFEKIFRMDGVLNIVLIRVPVSLDDTNYVDAGAIADGDYYYYNGSIYLRTAGAGVLVEDLLDLVGVSALTNDICEDISTPLLAIKFSEIRKEYRIQRDKECDDAIALLEELSKLRLDIEGAYDTFYSDLLVEAQNQVEDLITKYSLEENSV